VVFLLIGAVAVAFQARGAVAQEKEKEPGKLETGMERRAQTTDEDLRKQLQLVAETGFDKLDIDGMYIYLANVDRQKEKPQADFGPRAFEMFSNRANRPEMAALPWLDGPTNELTKEKADDLRALAIKIHLVLDRSARRNAQPDPAVLRTLLTGKGWTEPRALPALTQILQTENAEVRLVLVEVIGKIRGEEASIALAKRALFDLSPTVREKAVRALAGRPDPEYTPILISGLRYPWPAAADHAAEALAALKRTDLVPELVNLLKEPDPTLPVKTESGYSVKEFVRINHLCNCLLCHAPALARADRIRGRVVLTSEEPPASAYEEKPGTFVRADLTYLRPDFSVVQPVANPGHWPSNQRYDYLLRTRQLNKQEQTAFQKAEKDGTLPKSYPQQASVLFGLRELTGKDYGSTYEDWANGLQKSGALPVPQPQEKPDPQKQ
jgi:hypothetical protein